MSMLFEASIFVKKDSELYAAKTLAVTVDVFPHQPQLIDVCTPDGGASMSVDEAKQLISALQQAVDVVEATVK